MHTHFMLTAINSQNAVFISRNKEKAITNPYDRHDQVLKLCRLGMLAGGTPTIAKKITEISIRRWRQETENSLTETKNARDLDLPREYF